MDLGQEIERFMIYLLVLFQGHYVNQGQKYFKTITNKIVKLENFT